MNLEKARVLPYSDRDANVGKRVSRHPLHDTYIGPDSRARRAEFYAKSTQGMLVPEINEPTSESSKRGQSALFEQPLPRVERVFTMPIKELFQLWRSIAQNLHSLRPENET